MSKILVIIRHGKSTWEYGPILDLDRPLKEIGISKTLEASQQLKKQNIDPDMIISSPAIRALHTALIVARELEYPSDKIRIDDNLYAESEEGILEFIKTTSDSINCLFIFGHNPKFTFLANHFLKQPIDNLPTSGVILLKFNALHWNEISKKTVQAEVSIFPGKDKF